MEEEKEEERPTVGGPPRAPTHCCTAECRVCAEGGAKSSRARFRSTAAFPPSFRMVGFGKGSRASFYPVRLGQW